ncbi:hypothetical protein CANARDRAFT_7029 [[Candida] arabinofermentans NRRL YB-2248]|uniref:Uncharacterized protein n=1 Tax=[Candida] arabinofermentans NRRL YB-2248 TaxID=983967 RepID=A0A1E4T475_9ASCO|nr:hypothetical protein CANARDRAFT_7029 [[Candida] arabinofermentans NRRL YB-2248]
MSPRKKSRTLSLPKVIQQISDLVASYKKQQAEKESLFTTDDDDTDNDENNTYIDDEDNDNDENNTYIDDDEVADSKHIFVSPPTPPTSAPPSTFSSPLTRKRKNFFLEDDTNNNDVNKIHEEKSISKKRKSFIISSFSNDESRRELFNSYALGFMSVLCDVSNAVPIATTNFYKLNFNGFIIEPKKKCDKEVKPISISLIRTRQLLCYNPGNTLVIGPSGKIDRGNSELKNFEFKDLIRINGKFAPALRRTSVYVQQCYFFEVGYCISDRCGPMIVGKASSLSCPDQYFKVFINCNTLANKFNIGSSLFMLSTKRADLQQIKLMVRTCLLNDNAIFDCIIELTEIHSTVTHLFPHFKVDNSIGPLADRNLCLSNIMKDLS